MDNFEDIKGKYYEARKEQRTILRNLLKDNQYKVKEKGKAGGGCKDYNSGENMLSPDYDLRNHMWVEAEKDGIGILISLNPFDVDTNSGNPHHLYDRIGIQAFLGENTEASIRTAMIITPYSLPINENNGNDIVKFCDKLVKMLIFYKEQK